MSRLNDDMKSMKRVLNAIGIPTKDILSGSIEVDGDTVRAEVLESDTDGLIAIHNGEPVTHEAQWELVQARKVTP